MPNSLDPGQARNFVAPDLDTNCLQRLSADDTCRQRFNHYPAAKNAKLIISIQYSPLIPFIILLPCAGIHCVYRPFSLGGSRAHIQITLCSAINKSHHQLNRRLCLNQGSNSKPHSYITISVKAALWLSGRVRNSRPRGRESEPDRRHCVMSLSKTH